MQFSELTQCHHCLEAALTPSLLDDIRLDVKQILISTGLLDQTDFYQAEDICYIPQKLILKKYLNFKYTFDQAIVSRCIFKAHQRDQSFEKITQSLRAVLSTSKQEFSCLLILASGSGYLTSHVLSEFQNGQLQSINHTVYGVDISPTMNRHSLEIFSKINAQSLNVRYQPVISNCASFDDMSSHILELTQAAPVLTVSHGGVRYFAEGQERLFLESLSTFPVASRIVITEVGHELSELMYKLADLTTLNPNLEVLHFSLEDEVTWHNCWNLTYYYFLMQQYLQSVSLRSYIDNLYSLIDTPNTCSMMSQDFFICINFILLEIAGSRKQPVHLLDLQCTGHSKHLNPNNGLTYHTRTI